MSMKPKFKPMPKEDWATPMVDVVKPNFLRPTPQPIFEPSPEDIPALVKSDVEMAFYVRCTPKIMQACLELNRENYRPLGIGWSDQIKSDMEALPTRFKRAGDPIRFDIDGLMIDGQHRFDAGVRANFTFVFLFVVGLPKEAREVIDFGRPRKISHVVRNMGYDDPYLLSAAAAWLCRFKKGQQAPSGLIRGKSSAGTVEEILDTLKRHPQLHESTKRCKQIRGQILPGSLLAAVHYIGAVCLKKPKLADEFIATIKGYPKVKRTLAPFALSLELEQRQQRGLTMSREFKASRVVEAWNLFMQGIEVTDNNIEVPPKCTFQDLDYDLL